MGQKDLQQSSQNITKHWKTSQIQENGRIAVANQPQTSWLIGNKGLRFGKGGVPADGMGLGGAAGVRWHKASHIIEKMGGMFFTVTVNGKAVSGIQVLRPGDAIVVGKSAFVYTV